MKSCTTPFLVAVVAIVLTGCTQEQRAKNFGGDIVVDVKCDNKLFDVMWKDDNLWYAVRPMRSDEKPETFTFIEQSSFSIWEGTVTFNESRCQE